MKNRIQYVYSCSNAFFTYLNKGENLDVLIKDLERIQNHAKDEIGGKDNSLWFKFGDDDTLATDIRDIKTALTDSNVNGNRALMFDQMKRVTTGIDPQNELRVFYS